MPHYLSDARIPLARPINDGDNDGKLDPRSIHDDLKIGDRGEASSKRRDDRCPIALRNHFRVSAMTR
jgi:hypothetical protein